MKNFLAFLSCSLALATLCFGEDTPVDNYQQEILQWRAENESKLKSPTGWLALTGHYWLQPGINHVGTRADDLVKLPEDLPSSTMGVFHVAGNKVTFSCEPNSNIQVNGEQVSKVALTIESLSAESDSKDSITVEDRIRMQLVRRANRLAVRVRDKESKSIENFHGKRWFPIDNRYRVEANFTPYEPTKTIKIVNIRGESVDSELVGYVEFTLHGKQLRLDALADSPDELFLIFKDRTNGSTTYPPGRFLNVGLPVDGKLTLDFNKTYNPPCAFSTHTLCPMPPKQNHLDVSIEAGEMLYEPKVLE